MGKRRGKAEQRSTRAVTRRRGGEGRRQDKLQKRRELGQELERSCLDPASSLNQRLGPRSLTKRARHKWGEDRPAFSVSSFSRLSFLLRSLRLAVGDAVHAPGQILTRSYYQMLVTRAIALDPMWGTGMGNPGERRTQMRSEEDRCTRYMYSKRGQLGLEMVKSR